MAPSYHAQSRRSPIPPLLAYGSPWIGDGLSVFLKCISSVHFTSLNITADEAEADALLHACLPFIDRWSFCGESNLKKVKPNSNTWDDVTSWRNTLHNLIFFSVSTLLTEPS